MACDLLLFLIYLYFSHRDEHRRLLMIYHLLIMMHAPRSWKTPRRRAGITAHGDVIAESRVGVAELAPHGDTARHQNAGGRSSRAVGVKSKFSAGEFLAMPTAMIAA